MMNIKFILKVFLVLSIIGYLIDILIIGSYVLVHNIDSVNDCMKGWNSILANVFMLVFFLFTALLYRKISINNTKNISVLLFYSFFGRICFWNSNRNSRFYMQRTFLFNI